ncbi:MAG: hypothetical protein K0S23_1849 [Fluviicola sp.]|jgi:hypothetical protein|nr:hypothetical protein [Fluviicola sp.]
MHRFFRWVGGLFTEQRNRTQIAQIYADVSRYLKKIKFGTVYYFILH